MRCFLLLLFTLSLSSYGESAVEVTAWSRATPPGGTSAAIYGLFTNTGATSLTLTSVWADFAAHGMIHDSRNHEDMTSMREGKLEIPAAATVELRPNGKHIMLMGLDRRLLEGCIYSLRLSWSDSSTSLHQFMTGGVAQLTAPKSSASDSCQ